MVKDDSLYIVAIVAVVAVVGLVIMATGSSSTVMVAEDLPSMAEDSDSTSIAGQAFRSISIDESEIREQSEDIKDQITGLTRPTSSSEENKTEEPKEVDKTAENNETTDSETPADESSVETEKAEDAPTKEEAETAETTEE